MGKIFKYNKNKTVNQWHTNQNSDKTKRLQSSKWRQTKWISQWLSTKW